MNHTQAEFKFMKSSSIRILWTKKSFL